MGLPQDVGQLMYLDPAVVMLLVGVLGAGMGVIKVTETRREPSTPESSRLDQLVADPFGDVYELIAEAERVAEAP